MEFKEILELIDKLDSSSLTEIRVKNGEDLLHLKKGGDVQYVAASVPAAPAAAAPAAPAPLADSGASAPVAASDTETVNSPIVGTFYSSPSPDSPSYVEVGKTVKAGDTICIIEAMKVMNQLEAEFDMEIVNVLVENGTMLEYGAPIFEVRRK